MPPVAEPSSRACAESLLAFWADAGVDAMLLDAPLDRIEAGKFVPPPPPARTQAPAATVSPIRPVLPGQPDLSEAAAQAQALAATAESLDQLAELIAGFEGCPLRHEGAASRAVFARGDPQAPLMVIGEGPGADEDRQGAPFVGRAGQLLDRMLAAAGLAERVFITNTVFWRPPGNRTPTPAEQATCAPFVERAFALLKPKAVLLVGAASSKFILGTDDGILKLRGQWREWRLAEGGVSAPALPTLHPAFLLRQPLAKRQAWADMLALAARLDDGAGR